MAGPNLQESISAVTENGEPYRLNDQVGYLMRLANQRHSALFQEVSPVGLTPTQFAALMKLAELGECSQNELGRRTAMDVATIKGVVERLRKKGLVEVNSDPNDKRRAVLSLAPDSLELMSELTLAGKKVSDLTLAPLSLAEQKTFLKLLRKLG